MPSDLGSHARALGLDIGRFWDELRRCRYAGRIAEDVASADASGVAGTPSFVINGKRHNGAYDVATLTSAVRAARARAPPRSHAMPRAPGSTQPFRGERSVPADLRSPRCDRAYRVIANPG